MPLHQRTARNLYTITSMACTRGDRSYLVAQKNIAHLSGGQITGIQDRGGGRSITFWYVVAEAGLLRGCRRGGGLTKMVVVAGPTTSCCKARIYVSALLSQTIYWLGAAAVLQQQLLHFGSNNRQ